MYNNFLRLQNWNHPDATRCQCRRHHTLPYAEV